MFRHFIQFAMFSNCGIGDTDRHQRTLKVTKKTRQLNKPTP